MRRSSTEREGWCRDALSATAHGTACLIETAQQGDWPAHAIQRNGHS